MTNLFKRHPYITFALCEMLYLYPFMRVILPPGDEGTLIYDAVRVAQGQVPYRDFFEVMGPGTFYWVALFFKVFGTTWFATRVALMLTCIATGLLVLFLSRRLRFAASMLPGVLFIAVLFGYTWPAISHHGDSTVLALLSFSAFVLWQERRWSVLLIAAGVLAALTTFVLQPKGILIFLALLMLLGFQHRRDARAWSHAGLLAIGYCGMSAAVLLLFWMAGGLRQFTCANLIWPLKHYSGVNSVPYGMGIYQFYWDLWVQPITAALPPIMGYPIAISVIFPFFLIAALPAILFILASIARSRAFRPELLPYWVAGWALWLSEIHRKDVAHLIFGSPLLIILFFCLLAEVGLPYSKWAIRLAGSSLALLAIFNACLPLAARVKTKTVRGSVYMLKKDAVLDFLNSHLRPGEDMFVYACSPMYYFLSGANNPTKYSIFLYQMNTDAQFVDAVRSLRASSTRYVIWDNNVDGEKFRKFFPAYTPPPKEGRLLEQYLNQHFTVVLQEGGTRVLERRDALQAERTAG